MDSLVFSCRYREEFGQLHLKDGGDVRIFGDDTVRFDGEKRELAFNVAAFGVFRIHSSF